MIILPIHKSEEDDTPSEWSLLELNGELLTPKKEPEGDSMELGKIEFNQEGTPVMTIASHELKGKIQTLKQPFVIMKPRAQHCSTGSKRPQDHGNENENENENGISSKRARLNNVGVDGGTIAAEEETLGRIEGYEVAGVVTSKILFDGYPKSIMR